MYSKFYNLKIKGIMDKRLWDLPLIEENTGIDFVLLILVGRSHVWVLKDMESKELVGVITEHDALVLLTPENLKSDKPKNIKKAKDIMTTKLIICTPDEKIYDVIRKMVTHGIRRLPVLKDKKLVGEINLHHLIEKYYSMQKLESRK